MGGSGAKNRRRLQRQAHQLSQANSASHHNNEYKTKDKKFQKPKHLKRKLQQAAAKDPEKEKLLRQLNEYEQSKSSYRQHKKKKGNRETKCNSTSDYHSFAPDKEKDKDDSDEKVVKEESTSTLQNTSSAMEHSTTTTEIITATKKDETTSSNELDDDSDSDSSSSSSSIDDSPIIQQQQQQQRQRGKRRRGRKDTSRVIQEQQQAMKDTTENKSKMPELSSTTTAVADPADTAKASSTSLPKDNKRRYCIGRKPVTDFCVNQTYDGTVVYVKPFGIFLDIHCHSDAFCHVSRLSDDYVESAETLYQVGDKVNNARVIEIDRPNKRITVSLQSEQKIADEQRSIQARQERRQKRNEKKKHNNNNNNKPNHHQTTGTGTGVVAWAARNMQQQSLQHEESKTTTSAPTKFDSNNSTNNNNLEHDKSEQTTTTMTPQELKRARKLARRAARRAERETQEEITCSTPPPTSKE